MLDMNVKVITVGIVSGMRSMGGPALVSQYLTQHPSETLEESSLGWLGTPRAALITKFLAVGEIVGDKLPMTPNRIAPGPLFGRVMSSALCGAALYASAGRKPATGAMLGIAAAVLGAFGFFSLRMSLGQASKIPDPVIGAVEDILAYGVGWIVVAK